MHPKRNIDRLNRVREGNAKIKFARKRIWETVVELSYARGNLKELPDGMAKPAEWAMNAARLLSARWLRPLDQITPEEIRADPQGVLRELLGVYDAMVATVNHLSLDLPRELKSGEEGKALKELAKELGEGHFRRYLANLEGAICQKLPAPTHEQLVIRAQRYQKGLTAVFSPDDDFGVAEMSTHTAKLYFLVWFFWPKLVTKIKLRAADLEQFLFDETGLRFGEKLVQRVYTELKIAAAWAT